MKTIFSYNLSLLFLSLIVLGFSACDDDDGGIDFGIDDDGTLFISSNTSGSVGVATLDEDPFEILTFMANGTDSDGLYYNEDEQQAYQIDRTNNLIALYEDVVDDVNDDEGVDLLSTSTSNFTNGRGMAVSGNYVVVAQDGSDDNDGQNQFVAYDLSDDRLTFSEAFQTDINLWGIRFYDDRTLLAVVDNSDSLAIFNNFQDNANDDNVSPDRFMKLTGITRTHGLVYNQEDDVAVFTDVADAGSDTDGAIIIVRDFSTKFNQTGLNSSDYVRIAGSNTFLGNPVDVAYDENTNRVYVAERANGGGQLLVFSTEDGNLGNTAPVERYSFAGISSLYLHRD